MADKLAELKASVEGISGEGLRLILEFAEFLVKHSKKKREPMDASNPR